MTDSSRSESGFGSSAFDVRDVKTVESVDEYISKTSYEQLHGQFGWDENDAIDHIKNFLTRKGSRTLIDSLQADYPLQDGRILEVGSGLGNTLLEMRLRGFNATGLEPSKEWCEIIKERLRRADISEDCVEEGYGEKLPFEDCKFDFVISSQVLEHVKDPEKVLKEIDRVLVPGGILLLSAPNYMSFWEGHYKVRWFPFFTPSIASLYLKLLGRNPYFYNNHVNNLTYYQVIKIAKSLFWDDIIWDSKVKLIKNKRNLIPRIIRAALSIYPSGVRFLYHISKAFRPEISYRFQKTSRPHYQ